MTAAFHSSHSADLDSVVAAIIAQLQEKAAVQERVIGEKDAQLMRSRQALQTSIEFIIRKYADALPLYRQRAMLLRDLGIDVALTTIDDAVLRVGEQLITIVDVMKRDLLTGGYIQADDRGPHGQVFVRGVVTGVPTDRSSSVG